MAATDIFNRLLNSGKTPRYHGNGFAQLYLTAKQRLHVWSPKLAKLDNHNAQIHNHRYDATSIVLAGCLQHVVYQTLDIPEGRARAGIDYTVWGVTSNGELHGRGWCEARIIGGHQMVAGSHYSFNHPYFHTSDASVFTVTLFSIGEDKYPEPWVLAPYGQRPTDAFDKSRAPSPELLWEVIANAVYDEHVAGALLPILNEQRAFMPSA